MGVVLEDAVVLVVFVSIFVEVVVVVVLFTVILLGIVDVFSTCCSCSLVDGMVGLSIRGAGDDCCNLCCCKRSTLGFCIVFVASDDDSNDGAGEELLSFCWVSGGYRIRANKMRIIIINKIVSLLSHSNEK